MFEVQDFAALCEIGATMGKAFKILVMILYQLFPVPLRVKEKELLAGCAEHGFFQLIPSDGHLSIAVNGTTVSFRSDQILHREYLEALMRICRRGMVRYGEDGVFYLTPTAMRKARVLAAQGWKPPERKSPLD